MVHAHRIAAAVCAGLALTIGGGLSLAQMVEVTDKQSGQVEQPEQSDRRSDQQTSQQTDQPTTKKSGRAKAQQYFDQRKVADSDDGDPPPQPKRRRPASSQSAGGSPHFLAIHVGTYIDSQAYDWGQASQNNAGNLNIGVTYKLGEWVNSADFMVRSEYTTYSLNEGPARKLSFLGMIMFPDTNSKFPLYFGVGLGPGFYLKQLEGHSAVSLDYQVVGGARFMNIMDNLGVFVEFGLKNDIQLFSAGQFNGLFIGAGTAWMF